MKVFVQIIDTNNGISQHGMIEEPVMKGKEIDNALAHFGVSYGSVDWSYDQKDGYQMKCGKVSGTSKVVNIVTIYS